MAERPRVLTLALAKTGCADTLATGLSSLAHAIGPYGILAITYLATSIPLILATLATVLATVFAARRITRRVARARSRSATAAPGRSRQAVSRRAEPDRDHLTY